MAKRISSTRWIPALCVSAVCLAALGAATFGASDAPAPVTVARPTPDAPVRVVRAPASAMPESDTDCRTCAMGAAKGWL